MSGPALSVCIPVFNAVRHIEAAVGSVLAQTRGDFELVVVDNRSDDGTWERLERLSDPRLRLLRNDTNIGAEGNWNRALAEARGRYVKLLCADDLLHPTCLESEAAVLDADDGRIALVTCRRDLVGDDGRRLPLPPRGSLPAGTLEPARVYRKIVRAGTNPIGEPCAVLMRGDAARKAGRFSAAKYPYLIDADFWCRVLEHGALHMLREPLCAFRLTRGSWSAALAGRQAQQTRAFLRDVAARPGVNASVADRLLGAARCEVRCRARQVLYALH